MMTPPVRWSTAILHPPVLAARAQRTGFERGIRQRGLARWPPDLSVYDGLLHTTTPPPSSDLSAAP